MAAATATATSSATAATAASDAKSKRRRGSASSWTTSASSSSSSSSRRAPQAVTTEGAWCCAARPLTSPSPPPRRASNSAKAHHHHHHHHGSGSGSGNRISSQAAEDQLLSSNPIKDTSQQQRSSKSPSPQHSTANPSGTVAGASASASASAFRIRLSPGRVSPLMDQGGYGKFNTALNAGLLNPSASASSPPVDKIRSSPTLFEMMAHEHDAAASQPRPQGRYVAAAPAPPTATVAPCSVQERHALLQERISAILGSCSPGSQFNAAETSDVRLTLTSRDGFSVTLNLHRHILAAHSSFFSAKLSERWSKQPQPQQQQQPQLIEMSDCDDVDVYVETLRLMYCKDIKRRLIKDSVSKVLAILKVSASIVFDAGMVSCLEYLEAVPWSEEEEEKITMLLSQLQLDSIGAGDVLKRITLDESSAGGSEEVLSKLLQLVLNGTDEKARKEIKSLVSRMLRESAQSRDSNDVSKESLYHSCNACLDSLVHHFMEATSCDIMSRPSDERGSIVNQIARQSDNLHWLLDILIDRHIADDFVRMWANQSGLAALHSRIPTMYRYEVSRLTARLCIALGKGQVLVHKDIRYSMLQTWLQPLFDDFGWMRRACKSLDKKVVEDGINHTILTLPLRQQQSILLNWFDRFLSSGDDCPNLQKAFEVWWRRTYVRPYVESDQNQLQVAS